MMTLAHEEGEKPSGDFIHYSACGHFKHEAIKKWGGGYLFLMFIFTRYQ